MSDFPQKGLARRIDQMWYLEPKWLRCSNGADLLVICFTLVPTKNNGHQPGFGLPQPPNHHLIPAFEPKIQDRKLSWLPAVGSSAQDFDDLGSKNLRSQISPHVRLSTKRPCETH